MGMTPGDREKDAVIAGLTLGGVVLVLSYYFCGAMYMISGNMLFAGHDGMTHVDMGYWRHARAEAPWLGFGIPILLPGLLYLLLHRRFPHFARGMGYSCIVAMVVALGAPFMCGGSSQD